MTLSSKSTNTRYYDQSYVNLRSNWQKLITDRGQTVDLNKVYLDETMYDSRHERDGNAYRNSIRGLYERSYLSDLFFSDANIDNVDKKLRYAVFLMSNGQYNLGPQDKAEVVIIMRSIFLNYSRNLKCNIKEQIARLNNIVVQKTAPDLLSRTTQYLKYLEDANESHKIIIAQPINVGNAGVKLLETSSALGFS